MKINKSSSTSKTKVAIIITCVLLLICASLMVYVYAFNGNLLGWQANNSMDSSGNKPATSEQKQAGETKKQETVEKSEVSPEARPATQTPEASKPTAAPSDARSDTAVSITAANQNGNTLQIRALISSIDSSGTCTLTISQSGRPNVTKTAPIQTLAHNSTCQGFDISTSELTTGSWTITLTYDGAQTKGTATQEITIR